MVSAHCASDGDFVRRIVGRWTFAIGDSSVMADDLSVKVLLHLWPNLSYVHIFISPLPFCEDASQTSPVLYT